MSCLIDILHGRYVPNFASKNQSSPIEKGRTDMTVELICLIDSEPLTAAENSLECREGHNWKIVDSIPRLIEGDNHYSATFGLQWQTFRKTQLDSYTKVPLSCERARRCLGESVWKYLHGSDQYHVLQAGCGAGRFTEILLGAPYTHVFSVDSSDAVDANQLNFPQNGRHCIFQADVVKLPFLPYQFDLVFCLGTVQHTLHQKNHCQIIPTGQAGRLAGVRSLCPELQESYEIRPDGLPTVHETFATREQHALHGTIRSDAIPLSQDSTERSLPSWSSIEIFSSPHLLPSISRIGRSVTIRMVSARHV